MKPKSLFDYPVYVTALNSLQHVRKLLASSDAKIEQIVTALNSQHESAWHAGHEPSLTAANSIDNERDALRREAAESVVAGGPAVVPSNLLEGIRSEYTRLAAERVILRDALKLAEQRLEQVIGAVSRIYASEVSDDYRAIIQKLDNALQQAAVAVVAERDFRETVNNAGFRCFPSSLEPMPFGGFGDLDHDNCGLLETWHKQAVDAGFLTKTSRLRIG